MEVTFEQEQAILNLSPHVFAMADHLRSLQVGPPRDPGASFRDLHEHAVKAEKYAKRLAASFTPGVETEPACFNCATYLSDNPEQIQRCRDRMLVDDFKPCECRDYVRES